MTFRYASCTRPFLSPLCHNTRISSFVCHSDSVLCTQTYDLNRHAQQYSMSSICLNTHTRCVRVCTCRPVPASAQTYIRHRCTVFPPRGHNQFIPFFDRIAIWKLILLFQSGRKHTLRPFAKSKAFRQRHWHLQTINEPCVCVKHSCYDVTHYIVSSEPEHIKLGVDG